MTSIWENGENGFNLVIKGIRVNASTVGDDEDIVANVMLNGTPVNSSPIKVADVTTGLIVKVDAATGLQCADEDVDGHHYDPGRLQVRDHARN